MNPLCENLKTVILLCSSSRGGSSITTEWLRQHTGILHLRAEINPLLHMAKLVYPYANTSDALTTTSGSKQQREILWNLLSQEVGSYHTSELQEIDWQIFVGDLYSRLQWQWPDQDISLACVQKSVDTVREEFQYDTKISSLAEFYCTLLMILRKQYPHIDPRWYDIDQQSIEQYFPYLGDLIPPKKIIEEPPFVLISPWRRASIEDLRTKPLVIKTPSNAYRIPFFRSFFSKQNLSILHLKRKAEHAINGLMNGWMYSRGFHSHWIHSVAIKHRDILPNLWKYDLPPAWQQFKHADLYNVCAFQWLSAHQHTQNSRNDSDNYHSIWFSSILNHDQASIQNLWTWMGVLPQSIQPISSLPLVMASCPPRAQRWFEKQSIIAARCRKKDILQCMEMLDEEK